MGQVLEQKHVNGVNVGQLETTVNAIKETPELAKFTFRATNTWINGGHNRTSIKDFYGAGQEDTSRTHPFVLDADEPPVLLGKDKGPNPVEYALSALAACLTTSLVYHAAARGIRIEEIESNLEGDLDAQGFLGISDGVRPGYQNIRATFRVKADAPAEQLEQLAKFSPVFDTISNPVPVSIAIEKR